MHTRFIFTGLFVCLAGVASCFSPSSGGASPDANFDLDSGSIDGFGDDSTLGDAQAEADASDATAGDSGAPESSADSAPPRDSGADTEAAATGDASDSGDAGGSLIRVANMAYGMAGAIDFCIAPAGGAFAGPVMRGLGAGTGVPYQAMSEYAAVAPETSFIVRVVAAGATSCAAGLVADATTGPSPQTMPTTVVLAGSVDVDAGAPLGLQVFGDDPASTSPPNNRTRFRVIHEAPALGPATIQIGATPYVIPVQTAVPYGATFAASTQTSGAVAPDAQGYVEPNMGSEQVELVLGGVETMSFYVSASNTTDSVTTFLVGSQGSAGDPLGFVACDELAAPTGHLAACTFANGAPRTIPVRALHAAPDQGAFDVCVVVGTLPSTSGLLAAAGVSAGLSFLQLTGDLTSIPAGTDFGVSFALLGQTCGTGWFVSLGSSIFFTELTVTVAESKLPPGPNYQQNIVDTGTPANPNASIVSLTSLGAAGGPSYDFFDTENGMSEAQLGGTLAPFNQYDGLSLTPDTYALRVADHATSTTVYSKAGIVLSPAQTTLLGWFAATSPSPGAVVQCTLDSRAASVVTVCTQ